MPYARATPTLNGEAPLTRPGWWRAREAALENSPQLLMEFVKALSWYAAREHFNRKLRCVTDPVLVEESDRGIVALWLWQKRARAREGKKRKRGEKRGKKPVGKKGRSKA